ncbi:hypothetical protein ACFL0W_06635, partial [Nanoarchaeota archaeon]
TIDGVVNATDVSSTSGTPTNHSVANFNDGTHYWNVTCIDDASNTNSSETRSFTVDSTAPLVYLETPANNTIEKITNTITFSYNTTDVTSAVENCSLYIDEVLNDTNITITEGASQNFVKTLANDYYNWSVSCDDYLGNTGDSETYYLNVSINAPIVTLNSPSADYYNDTSDPVSINFNWFEYFIVYN